MQARICGVRATTAIMSFRKIPGLPQSIAVNPTSQKHYDDFSKGPWPAYFHLAGEQDVQLGIGLLQKLGANPSEEDIRRMLTGFHLPEPMATDFGAVISVRKLLADVDPQKPFAVRSISPTDAGDVDRMSFDQQMIVLESYDRLLKEHDPETWRTKQVCDFLSGVWGQGIWRNLCYGAIRAVLIARLVGRIIAAAVIVIAILSLVLAPSRGGSEDAPSTPVETSSQPPA